MAITTLHYHRCPVCGRRYTHLSALQACGPVSRCPRDGGYGMGEVTYLRPGQYAAGL